MSSTLKYGIPNNGETVCPRSMILAMLSACVNLCSGRRKAASGPCSCRRSLVTRQRKQQPPESCQPYMRKNALTSNITIKTLNLTFTLLWHSYIYIYIDRMHLSKKKEATIQRLLSNQKLRAQAWIQYTRQKKGGAQCAPPRRNACLAARKIEVVFIASPISTNLHQHGSLKELARPSCSSAVRCQPLATLFSHETRFDNSSNPTRIHQSND